ncbi:L-glyceraldehyde 3-phosphate reductase [Propionibacterium australiense]|uniref:NADP-dependent oxidoreductase domain n=2 Tax=Propionibacterium australiense TaxID=119981 RepID=A0A383S3T1_9ACTN|nr:NADP-dependent oxidoreductase domain [Propionibacterium australiense]VEH90404.1 L-glyceraldehyde 3-phosphate reductase [Propionibacterium australiense]
MRYRRCGRSGLDLPVLSLGYWHNFGDDRSFEIQRAVARRAFDLGITHHDLANNYGPPHGAAEMNFGRLMREDFRPYRDEMIISTKAGWDMWPGPYGQGGGSRKYVLASLDQSLSRMGLDYVDIFYSHRLDATTPLEETMGALDTAVRQGKALYVGISSYDAPRAREAVRILSDMGTPLLIEQPSYSMLNRWIETEGLMETAEELGFGLIGFTALAQGLLTDRYLNGIPADSRAAAGTTFDTKWLNEGMLERLRGLNRIATERGQTLAQLALVWALRDPRMTSLVIGASSVEQIEQNVRALEAMELSEDELAAIDELLPDDGEVDLWAAARRGELR